MELKRCFSFNCGKVIIEFLRKWPTNCSVSLVVSESTQLIHEVDLRKFFSFFPFSVLIKFLNISNYLQNKEQELEIRIIWKENMKYLNFEIRLINLESRAMHLCLAVATDSSKQTPPKNSSEC